MYTAQRYTEAEWSFKRVLQLDTQCEDAVVELDRINLLRLEVSSACLLIVQMLLLLIIIIIIIQEERQPSTAISHPAMSFAQWPWRHLVLWLMMRSFSWQRLAGGQL